MTKNIEIVDNFVMPANAARSGGDKKHFTAELQEKMESLKNGQGFVWPVDAAGVKGGAKYIASNLKTYIKQHFEGSNKTFLVKGLSDNLGIAIKLVASEIKGAEIADRTGAEMVTTEDAPVVVEPKVAEPVATATTKKSSKKNAA